MKRAATTLLLLLLCIATMQAGGVMNVTSRNGLYLFPQAVDIHTTIQNQVAITVTTQTFRNTTGAAAKLGFLFPVPINATVTGFRWWQNGELRTAGISGKPQDTSVVGSGGTGSGGGVTALDAYLGQSPFIFPFKDSIAADSSIVVELTYAELLRYGSGTILYEFPMSTASLGAPPLRLSMTLALETNRDILSMTSPSHPDLHVTAKTRTAIVSDTIASLSPDRDIEVRYSLAQSALGVTLMSNKPAGDDGYFIMLAEPDPQTAQGAVIDKTFTFIIDVSGSMQGAKLANAKEAARYTIEHLNPSDRFNVIKFSDNATKFQPDPVLATSANIRDGVSYIESLGIEGGTNLEKPLMLALGQNMGANTSNVIVFLTDGIASLDQAKIQAANTSSTRIFVFGIGTDVNTSLLTTLATNNNGLAEFLGADDVNNRIPSFYNKIRNPLLQDIQLSFTAGDVYEVYPKPIPDIYVGEQLVVLGRYKQPGPAKALLHGRGADREADYSYDVVFTGDSLIDIFIPKMWAKYKIDHLLILMQTVQQNSNQWKEWRDEIVRLSRLYGILSPFSSFTDPGSGGNGGPSSSSVEMERPLAPADALALRAYPNPFRASSTLSFTIPVDAGSCHATVAIYDVRGRLVALLVDARLEPGTHELRWDGRDDSGRELPQGNYICRVQAGAFESSTRIMLVR
jgi:Ca-activated chloride channel family protein